MGLSEQVAHVLAAADQLLAEPGRTVDILPYAELPISPMALQCGTGNKMGAFRKANTACHTRSEDGVVEVFAFPSTLKMSLDSMWVSNIAAAFSPENSIDPVLVTKSGTLKPAPGLDAEEAQEPLDAPGETSQEQPTRSPKGKEEQSDQEGNDEADAVAPRP